MARRPNIFVCYVYYVYCVYYVYYVYYVYSRHSKLSTNGVHMRSIMASVQGLYRHARVQRFHKIRFLSSGSTTITHKRLDKTTCDSTTTADDGMCDPAKGSKVNEQNMSALNDSTYSYLCPEHIGMHNI